MIHHREISPSTRPTAAALATLALGLVLALPGCESLAPTAVSEDGAPHHAVQVAGDVIPGRFIVTLRSGFDPRAVAEAHGISPAYVYSHALNGFAGEIHEAARGLFADARVLRVEPDRWVSADGMQENPPWHLDRIDQRGLPMDAKFHYNRTGAGVTVYVIDSGIRYSHQEFGGRASNGFDFVWNDPNESVAEKGDTEGGDCRRDGVGHGTGVAALAGGMTSGVAREVNLVSVRVLGCNDPTPNSRTIAAVDWVTANHQKPAVANMSLGGGASDALDDAIRNSIAAGVTYTVSAGNRGEDRPPRLQLACNQSPARVRQALTAAATDQLDQKPSWSSYGECVDLFAPGEGITRPTALGDDTWRESSWGTSFSAPLVAGVAALYLQGEPTASPAQVFAAVIHATTKNIVTNAGSGTSANHLLYSQAWGDAVQPPPPSPPNAPAGLVAEAVSASRIEVTWTDNSGDEDGFRIERCVGDGCAEFVHHTEVGRDVTGYSDAGLVAETTYRYRVAAFNTGGQSGWSGVAEATTQPLPVNQPPSASFTYACAYLTCTFTDTSTDPDGQLVAWLWAFGDGTTSSARHPSHTYNAAEKYGVTLTVTDDRDATDVALHEVTVSAPPPASTVAVGSIVYTTHGGRNNNQHLTVTITVVDATGAQVAGALVDFTLRDTTGRVWNSTATTGSSGQVSLTVNNAPNGTYTTLVNSITASAMTWDGITPANSFTR
jgi:PKD repeat protein